MKTMFADPTLPHSAHRPKFAMCLSFITTSAVCVAPVCSDGNGPKRRFDKQISGIYILGLPAVNGNIHILQTQAHARTIFCYGSPKALQIPYDHSMARGNDAHLQTGFLPFIDTLWSSWVSRISGPASAVLLLLAFFVPNTAKLPTSIAAVVCLVTAAYHVWRVERLRSTAAEARLTPIFRFDLDHPSCTMKEGEAIYRRIALWNDGVETIDDCVVEICDATPSPPGWAGRYPIPLQVMHADLGQKLILRHGQPALIDFVYFQPGARDFTIMHAVPGKVAVYIPVRSFSVVLQASGRNVAASRHVVNLDISSGYPVIESGLTALTS
jgi:hypothetical protein